MRLLHVYAGPFPAVQGTQVLVDATCRLLAEAGHEVHLLTYAHAPLLEHRPRPYALHRLSDWPPNDSARSGPSVRKLVLDARLAPQAFTLCARLRPDLVHAHHYEALVACLPAARALRLPLVFHCHALLGPELATYFPRLLRLPASLAGQAADRLLPSLADAVGAVTPAAAATLRRHHGPRLHVALLTPHVAPLVHQQASRPSPDPNGRVRAVYIGNLDGYQDIDLLLAGLEELPNPCRDRLEVLIVTDSDPRELLAQLEERRLRDFVRVVPHGSPQQAADWLHSAHIALVPRTTTGGVPIKLINALRANVPVLADSGAASFLVHRGEAYLVDMKASREVARGLAELVDDHALRAAISEAQRPLAEALFSAASALRDLEALYALVKAPLGFQKNFFRIPKVRMK